MDSLPVTLIVKAPNQQIEDQKIRCETSWTINKLKQHLSEVYPSKPPQHEQKLIYSGQLLNDSLMLKDVLRQYEGQDTHTVHLVCTPPKVTKMRPQQPTSQSAENGSNQSGSTSQTSRPQTQPGTETINNRVPMYSWVVSDQGQVPQMNLSQYQLHMAWLQQSYMQYVQYMQLGTGQYPFTSPYPNQVPTNVNSPPEAAQIPQPPQAEQNNHQPDQPNGAVQQPQQENEERDWLDVFYMLSRVLVLFSVVYFYSSPLRFIFVLFLAVVLYLYQAGFFRNININNNNMNGTPPEGVNQEVQAPTRFTVAWTFITTFFASLIPEIPNINA
ncbi:hypothetical protein ABEB36_003200 [Hypothenemus hampei]|uniref:Ubiquitin-like domain-containing protein n=1 Tax=Hypothenemus hampei TaxID=57062 RepID=A0ABD1F8E4_HYPHA